MSWQATAWAAKQVTGSPARKALLLALANYADAAGMSYPSQDTLARDTEQSTDTVQRQMKQLAALGLVRIEKRPAVKGQWPGLVYFLALPVAETTEPQIAARSEPQSHAARNGRHRAANSPVTVPQNTPSPCRTALRHEQKEQIEPRGRARASAPARAARAGRPLTAEGSLRERCGHAGPLGAGGEALRRRIGDDRFAAWFSKVTLLSDADGEIVLSAPTSFIRDHITAQFDADLDAAWRSATPDFRRVVIVHQRGGS
ncbi:helix-turn-helix domain-containing protein [Rhodopseudomonas palustris]|uniref:helix-turn-helix domain-containing protein n=1 Tax=Rhodopseudomonas palustris TaxID=1076 RepID=UPI0021F26C7E|nr:helix-turn-helix domain-containing protein [Rhodopseudomonas palustris]UYO55696.1 helix-turn-helix domain-containing protein [Rhodopseudomonas palustris]